MIKDPLTIQQFEMDLKRKEKPSFQKSLEVFTSLWVEAMHLGVIPLKDPLEGIETDIRVARILNSCLKNSSQN